MRRISIFEWLCGVKAAFLHCWGDPGYFSGTKIKKRERLQNTDYKKKKNKNRKTRNENRKSSQTIANIRTYSQKSHKKSRRIAKPEMRIAKNRKHSQKIAKFRKHSQKGREKSQNPVCTLIFFFACGAINVIFLLRKKIEFRISSPAFCSRKIQL